MHLRFITSTPLNLEQGSGTFAGISLLARVLRDSGQTLELVTPKFHLPIYTAERLLFNERLRLRPGFQGDAVIGFDMDGYALAGKGRPHIAAIKGVIADEMRFESGFTRATMQIQAGCEHLHVQRADLVIATSRYSAERIRELYKITREPSVVPELLDLASWRQLLEANPAPPAENKFTVLSVCRFYPRKRLHILLGAADLLRDKIPGLAVRVVGGGPESARLQSLWRDKNLRNIVSWLGDVSQAELAREYNRCHIFCLPSVQEAFGIVFLEAMAAGKPIVAARAGAAPEVVRHGILAEPDDEQSLADGIERLYRDSEMRQTLAASGSRFVRQFDAPLIAQEFLATIRPVVERSVIARMV